jgi:hypothetical protein
VWRLRLRSAPATRPLRRSAAASTGNLLPIAGVVAAWVDPDATLVKNAHVSPGQFAGRLCPRPGYVHSRYGLLHPAYDTHAGNDVADEVPVHEANDRKSELVL